ncbi:hypothetical protein OV203_05350 [Nannocystis sp. ILAH1]|uniref:hypothetical protein n=1 Tax=unclassified Nannocystis TaxID=2627009 RepID=UPI00226D4BFC|nr:MULTISPECIES: hypothetical protein [unclassified Nannocystis]MCY0986533.1 hypothetical protein [Nannocystis sp. ILAH1]MCY1071413.1 hypothetical protein [Nannocystis sp. RBIL2]
MALALSESHRWPARRRAQQGAWTSSGSTGPGYFAPDTFTFGAPLQRLTIEAVVGAVPGVLAVKDIRIGARAVHHMRPMEDLYVVPDDQILRLASDPRTPERDSIRVITGGGV